MACQEFAIPQPNSFSTSVSNSLYSYNASKQLQPARLHSTQWLTVVVPEAVDSANEDEETVDAVIEVEVDEAGEDDEEPEESPKRKNGSPSPNSVDSSRPAKSKAWNKSTSTRSPSKNIRSSTGSCRS